eukprot:7336391-Pyramimonas_sp.AAC.1
MGIPGGNAGRTLGEPPGAGPAARPLKHDDFCTKKRTEVFAMFEKEDGGRLTISLAQQIAAAMAFSGSRQFYQAMLDEWKTGLPDSRSFGHAVGSIVEGAPRPRE